MSFDSLVANPGRLRILTALACEPQQEFVTLRNLTRLTDGNLSTHARRLAVGGLVSIQKSFRDGKPVTRIDLTPRGREALEHHAHNVLNALQGAPMSAGTSWTEPDAVDVLADEWVD